MKNKSLFSLLIFLGICVLGFITAYMRYNPVNPWPSVQ